ncbi:MAG: metallophosphoesterase [Candidatus Eisenbacteria bacterium]
MRFLYVTDLHGDATKYERALEVARDEGVAAVVNGGDLLPKGVGRSGQESFLRGFLDPHLSAYDDAGVTYMACLGNDDLIVHDDEFDAICERHPSAVNLAQRRHALDGLEFVGMNWVVDYPFRLKDRCRMDHDGYEFQTQFGSGLLSTRDGFTELEDWFAYARTLPTIEDELRELVRPEDMSRAVYVMHMPPANLGLDECGHGESVGSESVYRFIEREQPFLTMHGHIHESPEVSKLWLSGVGDTFCLQPGQSEEGGPLSHVVVDTDEGCFERRAS